MQELLDFIKRNRKQLETQVFLCYFMSIFAKTVDVCCIFQLSDGQAISANISGQRQILTIACLTFYFFLTDRPTLGLPEYRLKAVNICKMHGTGGLEVVVL